MKQIVTAIFLSLFSSLLLHAQESIDKLLADYIEESDLSKITKIDSAGPVQVFTQDDLQKMQVKNLSDVINALYAVYLNRSKINTTTFARPVTSQISTTYTRLYINDHDVSSPFFGSAFFIWGEMPIEYIDHIEVYTVSSSLEFGNENGSVIFRLYTKTAHRDNGSKIRLMADNKQSCSTNIYNADIFENGFNYFVYGNFDTYKRKKYYNYYNNTSYKFDSDYKNYNLFANMQYKEYSLDVGMYKKNSGNFIGLGNYMGMSLHNTPYEGNFYSRHNYFHLTKKLKNRFKIQLSYDHITTERDYNDPNGIKINHSYSPAVIKKYNVKVKEKILSLTLEKRFEIEKHKLLLGSFYKYKSFDYYGNFTNTLHTFKNDFSNSVDFYSLYAEDNYNYDKSLRFILSVKGDFYRYEKDVKSQNNYLARVGFIKQSGPFKYKLFYARSYVALAFFQTYNPNATPYKANPNLDNINPNVYTGAVSYTTDKSETSFEISQGRNKSAWVYNPSTPSGWQTKDETTVRTLYQLHNSYKFDPKNRLLTTLTYGKISLHPDGTPKVEFMLTSFNTYKKFDLYNSFTYRKSYKNSNVKIPNSYDLTSAVKYHYNKNLSFGIRGENILNKTYRQYYKGLQYTIPTVDQKFWINLEYLF